MNNFEFQNPTKIIFGKGQIAKIADEIPQDKKIMITYGGGSIKRNGVYDQVISALKNHNVIEFGGIEPNPKYETLMKGVEIAKKEGVNYLLAVGGGSIIDGTKFMAVAINYNEGEGWDLIMDQAKAAKITPTPLSTVLTLPATGSEMNCGAVISRLETIEKHVFMHAENFPRFSVLDPETCYTLPKKQIANGIVDTFVHIVEQYITYPANAMVQDRFSEGILNNLVELATPLLENQEDYDLMSNFMWSATWALNGVVSAGVPQDWATHMIGHELTALHGLDHGVTLAIVYPALLEVMREEKKAKILQYAERVWNITEGNDDERIDAAINKTREFFESVGINTKLSSYGVGEETIAEIEKRFTDRKMNLGENGSVKPEKVREILEKAM